MTPAERRTALVRVLARIDQQLAECEALASQPVLSYEEEEYVAVHLAVRLQARKRAERRDTTEADIHHAGSSTAGDGGIGSRFRSLA